MLELLAKAHVSDETDQEILSEQLDALHEELEAYERAGDDIFTALEAR